MKLSQLRMCDNCDGPVKQIFYVVRLSLAAVSPNAFNQVAGLTQMYGGALGLAEVMAPDADVVKIAGDEDKALMKELLICQECYMTKPLDLPILAEKRTLGALLPKEKGNG